MVKLKMSMLMVAAAAALTGLGVVWAEDKPRDGRVGPPRPLSAPALGPAPIGVDFSFPLARPVPAAVVRTPNFVVHADSPVIARAVAAEAEFQRKDIARRLLTAELPDWPTPCEVHVVAGDPNRGSATGLEFATFPDGKRSFKVGTMHLRGSFLEVLTELVPHEVTHAVLASYFKKPLPRWADEGIASLAESAAEQAKSDARSRELLAAGRGIRLRVLFRMSEYPNDMMVLFAQGNSVCRFLLTRSGPDLSVPPLWSHIPHLEGLYKKPPPESPERRLLVFLVVGAEGNTAETWARAAKLVYGFESVDALEEAWLDWLKKPESRLPSAPPAPRLPERDTKPDLIPPVNLRGDKPQAKRPSADATPYNSRQLTLRRDYRPGEKERTLHTRLFVSRDEGKTWELRDAAPPDREQMMYTAPADGVYWLYAVRVYSDRTQDPPEIPTDYRKVPKILVDTTPPVVRLLAAERDGKLVRLDWEIDDVNPDEAGAVAEYRPAGKDAKWRHTPVAARMTHVLLDAGKGPVEVRVRAKDRAGNEGVSAVKTVE